MHPITVRTMRFEVPDPAAFNPLCIAGNATLSYAHLAFAFYVGEIEPFFVKSLHRVLPRIEDDTLREEVDRFCRQEAQHYQQHADFNRMVLARGYPGIAERVARLRRDIEDLLAADDDLLRLGYIEGFEAYTTQFALMMCRRGLYDHAATDPALGQLFKWHMLEEIEHRNVAFDVYTQLGGRWPHRARVCWQAQSHMFRFIDHCARLMSDTDVQRHGPAHRQRRRDLAKLTLKRTLMRGHSMRPGYTPHAYELPSEVGALSAHFTRLAVSTR